MKKHNLEVLIKLLKPVSKEKMEEIVRSRTGDTGGEQLTLADAGLTEEFRILIAQKNSSSDLTS